MIQSVKRFYVTGGTIPSDSPSYVVRKADQDLLSALKLGQLCYVLTSRQMGKSSLMVRAAARLREEGATCAVLDLTAIGQNVTAERWYDGLLNLLARQLNLEDELEQFWLRTTHLGPMQRWMQAVQEVVLENRTGRIVIFIDEIDAVRSLPFSADEFFAGIRQCFNQRSEQPDYDRLTFCLLGVATPTDLIRDTRMTPFNIGTRVDLTDFTMQEAATLAAGLVRSDEMFGHRNKGLTAPLLSQADTAARLFERVLYWTGGHPYFTQRLCEGVRASLDNDQRPTATRRLVDRVCEELFLSSSARDRDDNLLFVRERLLRSEVEPVAMLSLYALIWRGKRPMADQTNPLVSLLQLSGVSRELAGTLHVRNRIYHRVFDLKWVSQNFPNAELRRLRAAYRRGVLKSACVAALVVTIMAVLAAGAIRSGWRADAEKRKAERAAAERQSALIAARKGRDAANEGERHARASAAAARASEARALEMKRKALAAEGAANRGAEREKHLSRLAQQAAAAARTFSVESRRATADARKSAVESRRATADASHLLYDANMRLAQESLDAPAPQVGALRTLLEETSHSPFRGFEWGYLYRQCTAGQTVLSGHTAPVSSVAAFPDGKRFVTGSVDHTSRIWDVATQRTRLILEDPNDVFAVAVTHDGKRVLTAGAFKEVHVWDAAKGTRLLQLKGLRLSVSSIAISGDDRFAVTAGGYAGQRTELKIWDLAAGKELYTLVDSGRSIVAAAISPDSKHILTADGGGVYKSWNASSHALEFSFQGEDSTVNSVDYSPDGKHFVSGSPDGSVIVWQTATGREIGRLTGHAGSVSASYSLDGAKIVTAGADHTARLWNAADGKEICTLRGHTEAVLDATILPGGKQIVTTSRDGSVRIWDLDRLPMDPVLHGHTNEVLSVDISRDSRRIVTGSADGTARVWDAPSGKEILTLPCERQSVFAVAFSPDGRRIATAGGGDIRATIRVWDATTGSRLQMIDAPRDGFGCRAIAFMPDGRRIVAAYDDNVARMWDLNSGKILLELKGHTASISSIAVSPDGRWIVTGSWANDCTVRMWSASTGAELWQFGAGQWGASSVAFSPDGTRGLCATGKATVHVWDSRTGHIERTLPCPAGGGPARFSQDGRRIIVGGADGTVRLWDAANGRELLVLKGHSALIFALAASRDNLQILSASGDHTVRVWNAAYPGAPPAFDVGERTSRPSKVVSLPGRRTGPLPGRSAPRSQEMLVVNRDNTVRLVSASGKDVGCLIAGGLNSPGGAAFDAAGRLYICNEHSNTIRRYSITGEDLGLFVKEGLIGPTTLTFDPIGNLYVSNEGGHTIERFSPSGKDLGPFASVGADSPAGLAFDARGNLLVACRSTSKIRKFSSTGADLGNFVSSGVISFNSIAFGRDGNLYATLFHENAVHRFSPAGVDLGDFAMTGLSQPVSLAFDGAGSLYVVNYGPHTVRRFSPDGTDLGDFASIGLVYPNAIVFSRAVYLMLSATPVIGGKTVSVTVTLGAPAPSGGAVVALTASNGSASPPARIIIPAGRQISAPFPLFTRPTGSTRTCTITARYSGVSVSARITVEAGIGIRLNRSRRPLKSR